MKDPLEDSRLCLSRAKEHIVDLDGQIAAFLKAATHSRVTESHANGRDQITKIKFTHPIPGKVKTTASDVVINLRQALDLAGYGIAYASAGGSIPRHTYFPFGDSPSGLENGIKGKCKNLPQEIVAVFRAFKPYKGGNNLLWAINKLANTNKHKILVPIGFSIGGMHLKHMRCKGIIREISIPPVWDSAKNEIIIGVCGPETQIEYDMQIKFCVAFDKVEVIRGQPAVSVLHAQADIVDGILMAVEAEARRIGVIS